MATTGKPAIPDVKGDRPLSVAISNIRQRIEAIEGALGSVESTVNQSSSTGSTQFNVLRQQIAALQLALTALEAAVADLAADGSQTLLAVRSFTPRNPNPPAPPPEEQTNQIAVRAFMPHVSLTQARDVSDAGAQLATQAFARRPAFNAPMPPEEQTNQIAVRAFMPHVPLKQERGIDDAPSIIATQIFGA